MKISVNGQDYDSWDDVPEDVRHLLEQVMPHEDGSAASADQSPPEVASGDRRVRVRVEQHAEQHAEQQGTRRPTWAEAREAVEAIRTGDVDHDTSPGQDQVVLNGEVVDTEPRRKHWWQR